MRDSVLMYVSQCDALRDLPPEQFKASVLAIWDYAMKDIEPEADPVTMMAWKLCKPLLDRNNRNYENGKRTRSEPEANPERTASDTGATWERPRSEPEANPERTGSGPEANPTPKVKGERLNLKKEPPKGGKKESAKRFHPPTIEEVREYASEHGYNVDAARFIDFYESKGWKVGTSPMKDWKAAVRNWARSERQGKATKPSNSNFTGRDTNLDNLLKTGGLYG